MVLFVFRVHSWFGNDSVSPDKHHMLTKPLTRKELWAVHRFNTETHNLCSFSYPQILISLKTSRRSSITDCMLHCRLKRQTYKNHFKMITLKIKSTVIKPKNKAALMAVPEMLTFWTLIFHMTGAVDQSVNLGSVAL